MAIALLIKSKQSSSDKKVFYSEIFGERELKFNWLDRHNISNVEWKTLNPESPNYLLVPENSSMRNEYSKYWKITDIFPINNIGIVTSRDDLTIKSTPEEVWDNISDFSTLEVETARTKYHLGKDSLEWKVSKAQEDLQKTGLRKELIIPILYRPFDQRYTYYTGHSRGFMCRPTSDIMSHLMQKNLALLVMRQVSLDEDYTHFLVSESIVDNRAMLSSKGIVQILPLYLYDSSGKNPNISPILLEELKRNFNRDVAVEDIFYYIYGVFYSDKYRRNYAHFLRQDFPRIPFTKDYGIFKSISEIGATLVKLHLLKEKLNSTVKFDVQGSNFVDCAKWENGKFFINKTQYFEGIQENEYTFHIGGYQVLEKWLKSRKGRELRSEEIEQFIQIIGTIKETICLMRKIDELSFMN